ncbi:olfactory receptor 1L4-like [Dendropsophus ebraccatus]|uniref:olfactory receptor 1L4-like n=1 Tax=Dendropsophus ebraccatus TaxID=150705 RepID=UPI00383206F7
MEVKNETHHGFILLGFSDMPDLLLPLFSIFMGAYIICIVGNFSISMLIISQPQLHTPMYVLVGNLAFVDLFLTSITIPRALYGLISGNTYISFHGCFLQLFFLLAVGNMDSFLLAIMAFDRYSAVCHPLRYLSIMSRKTCICLVASSWVIVSLHSALYAIMTSSQALCKWVIPHFFCDLPVVMLLSCSVPSNLEQIGVFIECGIIILGPLFFILVSYILIIRAVLKLQTSKGRWKTFSTCSSHLTIVIIYYSTILFMYFRPSSIYSPANDRVISIVISLFIPMLNPFIYSLRNKQVKSAVKSLTISFKLKNFGRSSIWEPQEFVMMKMKFDSGPG